MSFLRRLSLFRWNLQAMRHAYTSTHETRVFPDNANRDGLLYTSTGEKKKEEKKKDMISLETVRGRLKLHVIPLC